jgi:hypothetical protein
MSIMDTPQLPGLDLNRLAKGMRLLSSDNDGERLAAVADIERLLQSVGLNWVDWGRLLTGDLRGQLDKQAARDELKNLRASVRGLRRHNDKLKAELDEMRRFKDHGARPRGRPGEHYHNKAMRMMDSPEQGERQNAIDACERILKAAGKTWGDLSREIEQQGEQSVGKRWAQQMLSSPYLAEQTKRFETIQRRHSRQMAELGAELRAVMAERDVLRQQLDALRQEQESSRRSRNLPGDRRTAVLALIRQGGQSDRAIARAIGVSPPTVGNLRRSITPATLP